jgi:hypothetical protein
MLINPLIYSVYVLLIQISNVNALDTTTTTPLAAANVATTATTPLAAANAATTATTPLAAANAATTATTPLAAANAATTATTTTTPLAAANAATTTPLTALTTATTPTALTTATTPTAITTATTGTTTPINTATTTTTPAVAATLDTNTDTNTDTSTDTGSTSSSTSSASSSSTAPTINPNLVSDSIVGTWSSKSNTVFTGPGFYDPVDELLIEPALPGISYSFTEDGYWEEAIYQVTPNPKNHSCPAAVLIYQHGTYTKASNGTLVLTPFAIDGRQLLSQPCEDNGVSIYSRYNQTEVFKAYQVYVDPYHGRWRIDLIKSNGAYMQPLYLAYQPPQMLPTITMNPVATDSKHMMEKRENGLDLSLADRIKRSLENRYKTNAIRKDSFNYSLWWWTSASMMFIGAVMFVMA